MRISGTKLAGIMRIDPQVHGDSRGFFLETYQLHEYAAGGIDVPFVQDNHSRSRVGTLRGLHFQTNPGQAKLVRVGRGRIQDVVVDIRRSSPTFGQHESFILDDDHHQQLFVPVGFAHGFCVLSDVADVIYKVSNPYDARTEAGIAWDDPDLGIQWEVSSPIISDRDRSNPTLADIAEDLRDW